MFKWLRNKFKSRAQRDRERGYYSSMPRVGSAHLPVHEQLDQLLAEANRAGIDRERVPAPASRIRPRTPWGRLRLFCQLYKKRPNAKEFLAILFPSEWLLEKLWPKWDPEDRNAIVAPPAGYYDVDTGNVYDHNHKFLRCVKKPITW